MVTSSYSDFINAIAIGSLKDKVTEDVRLASGGEVVLVTDRDRVVADLTPEVLSRALGVASFDDRLCEVGDAMGFSLKD